MKNNKTSLSHVNAQLGSSLFIKQHTDPIKEEFPNWQFHPEIELIYSKKTKGIRHIGNHLSYFSNDQLILIGANVPHSGFKDRFTSNGSETIVLFKEDFLGTRFFDLPEMHPIQNLFVRAKNGVVFGCKTKQILGKKIELLRNTNGIERILLFLNVLKELANTTDYSLLNQANFTYEIKPQDNLKIEIIIEHVRRNFQQSIPLEEIVLKVNMTVPAFCRYYKKVTGKTFTQFVNAYRIVHATKLLTENHSNITTICYESGFNNFSHFNKLFKRFTGKNPMKYRNELKELSI